MKTPRLILAGVLLLGTLAASGCRDTTPIRDILDDPARFGTETLRIQGEVKESIGVLGTGVYELDDGTGTIAVVSKAGGVPRQGARVGVEGTVRPAFTLGSQTLTVFMEEKRVSP
jgi:hypothetical protein